MQDSNVAVLLENIEGQIQLLAESVATVIDNQARDHELLEQIHEVVQDVMPMKATISDHNARLDALEMPQRA